MPSFNFADQYKAAGLNPGPEIIKLRQEPFDKIQKGLNTTMVLDLTRLYFGFAVPNGTEWFSEAFRETDASFSMIDNEREASVLAACLLAAALDAGNVCAGLAPIVAAAAGSRVPLVRPEFIEDARQALAIHSINSRQQTAADLSKIKQPVKSKVAAAVAEYLPAPNWNNSGDAIKLAANESFEATKTLANQVSSVISPLVKQVRDLREEVSMLWWYIGGWSRILEKPFSELDVGLAALMAGLDLAHLTLGESGPVAAQAILHRLLISSSTSNESKKIALKSAVDELPSDTFQQLQIPKTINSVSDLCPVLAALAKADEIGNGQWYIAFKKTTHLDAGTKFPLIELAMQVYRESLLLAQID
jgi:hypothetical protein